MPLSEREQKILDEIERHLHEEDPRLAGRTKRFVPDRPQAAVALLVAGLVLLVMFFVLRSIVIGIVAFGAMVAGIVLLTGSLHSPGGAARDRVTAVLAGLQERLRDRFNRS